MRHVVFVPQCDELDENDMGGYTHHRVSDAAGALWWVGRAKADYIYLDRAEVNNILAAQPTLSAKKQALDEWAEADILNGYDDYGMAYLFSSTKEYRSWAEAEEPDSYDRSPGMQYSRLDPTGVYLADGTKIGSTCHCEDYPCCGH